MYIKQFYLGCLAHASYLLASQGRACVIDPQRDIVEYLALIESEKLKLEYIIETHLHADFVSGHSELAEKTGATVVYSARAGYEGPHLAVKGGEKLSLGTIELTILATPGHTPESISIVAKEGGETLLFSGDTLFIGDVGRPDLAGGGDDTRLMAGQLYDSLHGQIMTLPDDTVIYPAHGAGSLCGKNISSERSSTLEKQKKFNWALKVKTRDEFIDALTSELPEVPAYFKEAVKSNRAGAVALDTLPKLARLDARALASATEGGATILDVRGAEDFGSGHAAGAINIGLSGQFASFSGLLLDVKAPIVLFATSADAQEARLRLARAGLENVLGYFEDLDVWKESGGEIVSVPQVPVEKLKERLDTGSHRVLDVRKVGEYRDAHVPGVKHIPLHELSHRIHELDKSEPLHVICAGGYRSSMAISLLLQNGFKVLHNVQGGTNAWRKANLPVDQIEEAASCNAAK